MVTPLVTWSAATTQRGQSRSSTNWWRWYIRLEAITSRPLLLNGVARLTRHAGQSRLLLTLAHEASDQIETMIANIRKDLDLN